MSFDMKRAKVKWFYVVVITGCVMALTGCVTDVLSVPPVNPPVVPVKPPVDTIGDAPAFNGMNADSTIIISNYETTLFFLSDDCDYAVTCREIPMGLVVRKDYYGFEDAYMFRDFSNYFNYTAMEFLIPDFPSYAMEWNDTTRRGGNGCNCWTGETPVSLNGVMHVSSIGTKRMEGTLEILSIVRREEPNNKLF
jgi:hypothetical protein